MNPCPTCRYLMRTLAMGWRVSRSPRGRDIMVRGAMLYRDRCIGHSVSYPEPKHVPTCSNVTPATL